MVSSYLVKI